MVTLTHKAAGSSQKAVKNEYGHDQIEQFQYGLHLRRADPLLLKMRYLKCRLYSSSSFKPRLL